MKVVIFATGRVAVPTVEQLCASRHTIVACVTQPARAQGRGLTLKPSPVTQAVQGRGVVCWQPERLDECVTQRVQATQPELGIAVDYGEKIPATMLRLPRHGMLGMHPSLLPKYRGAAPIQRAILNGDAVTGVTVFRMTEALDSGDVLLQDMTTIHPEETAVELRDRLAQQGAHLVVRAVDLLERGDVQWHPQEERAATLAPKLTKAEGRIDWAQPAQTIVNRIRGLQPWPGALTSWQGQLLKVQQGRVAIGCATATPGTIVQLTDAGLVISAGEGGVLVTMVQLAGGRPMAAAAFCRGHAVRVGAHLGASPDA